MSIKAKYVALALTIYLITAYSSLGHLHPDEYYQILEFAAFKLHLNSKHGLTWEFYQQIRPAFQAWLVVYLYKFIAFFDKPNPFFVTFLTRAFSALLSLGAVLVFINRFKTKLNSNTKQRWFILLSLFTYLAVFNSVRYSSENISAKLFLLGFALLFYQYQNKASLKHLAIGIILGFSFVTRYQIGFMLCGLMAWLLVIQRLKFSYWLWLCFGIAGAISLGLVIDHWFYGDWVFTPWRYFAANILQGKAATFSVDPWYMYLAIAGLIPYGPLYILASLYFIYRCPKHVISWVMLPFIVAHLLVAHKELRFLTPLLSFMPFVILYSLQLLQQKYKWQLNPKLIKLNQVAWYFNCLLLIAVMFIPSAMQIRINKLLYNNYQQKTAFNYLTEGGNVLDFYKHLNLRPAPIKNPKQLECQKDENCLLALTCQETKKYGAPSGRLIFSDCPSWVFKLNFNGWLDRTALYNIYELRSIESRSN